jgi:hypothetical protein
VSRPGSLRHGPDYNLVFNGHFLKLALVRRVEETGLELVAGVETTGEGMMDLWWIPVGLVAWFLVAALIGLRIGAVLKRCSEVRESVDQQWGRHQVRTSHAGTSGRQRPDGRANAPALVSPFWTFRSPGLPPSSGSERPVLRCENRMLLCEVGRGYRGGSHGEET